jgi:beta-glucosidase
MSLKNLSFPPGFLWGSATSSYQVEGGINNCDWALAANQGKVPKIDQDSPKQYEFYDSDFLLAKSLGQNCHRISIEWSRIEPEEGKFNDKEIEHYRNVLKSIRDNGMDPFVTLWHFTLPIWLSEKGGTINRKFPMYFARYIEYVIDRLGDLCMHWTTINEPEVFVLNGFLLGSWPPFRKGNITQYFKSMNNLIRGHKLVYKNVKKKAPYLNINIATHQIYFHDDGKFINKVKTVFAKYFWNNYFLRSIRGYFDSINVNYYMHRNFGERYVSHEKSDMGWDICPEGFTPVLLDLKKYKTSIYISEAGVADESDRKRILYLRDIIYFLHQAIRGGVDVRGFMYWSLIDNYEWAQGYTKKFGLVAYDPVTKERRPRPSAYLYKKICEKNALIDE